MLAYIFFQRENYFNDLNYVNLCQVILIICDIKFQIFSNFYESREK